jgi:hypothetical protein
VFAATTGERAERGHLRRSSLSQTWLVLFGCFPDRHHVSTRDPGLLDLVSIGPPGKVDVVAL